MADDREASSHAARTVRLIAQRELNTRLRTKSFVVGTIVIIAAIAGYLLLQAAIFGGSDRSEIGLQGQATSIAQAVEQTGKVAGLDVETRTVTDAGQARAKLADGELDVVVSGNPAELHVLVKSELDPQLRMVLNGISRQQVLTAQLARAGVEDPTAVMAEANAAEVRVSSIEPQDPESGQRLAIGLVVTFLLFMTISSYGALVAQGVVEEKASRVVEILLATVRPWHLLLGKVIGLGIVGLTQMMIIAGVGLAMAIGTGAITVSGVAVGTLIWGAVWYLLGFFLYATIYAGAGSLVSRQEDAQSVLTPVSMVLIIGFIGGFNLLVQDPNSTSATVLSLIPLLAPVLMPGRIAAGDVALLEIVLALGLTLATIALFTWLGARVYQNAVLHLGSRMKLADALRG